jgi:hypothetical protein
MSQRVNSIIEQIESLDELDREILEQRLHELQEARWKQEVESARAAARLRGIDQKTIDAAVDEIRYGS